MIDAAIRRRVKELEIRAIHLVSGRFMGEWASNMRGQGLEFRDLREYVVGDDVRRLDWKATARSGKPQLRQFTEERQQAIWFALDLSASMEGRKSEMARQILAVLGWAAVKQGDPFGLIGFTDRVEFHRPAGRGEAHLWAAVEDVVERKTESKQTNFAPLGEFFLKRVPNRATVVVLSDFAGKIDHRMLGALALRHELLAFQIVEPREEGEAPEGLARFVDSETGEEAWIDLSSRAAQERLREEALADRNGKSAEFRRAGAWHRAFRADSDFMIPLIEFFHRRMEAIRA